MRPATDALAGPVAGFLRRPVLTAMLNLLLVVAGVAAILGVEVRELPRAERDIVTVNAEAPGWAPDLMDSDVTAVLERALARVPGIAQLDAKSSLGKARVRAVRDTSVDPRW